jgi:hypothetical protein
MIVALGDEFPGGDDAVGPWKILDDDRLSPTVRQPFREQARNDVEADAGRVRHNHPDRALRPCLGQRGGRRERERT